MLPAPAPTDCFTPAQASTRGLDAHRAIRYDALLELIDQLQRRRSIDELAQAAASRWKHFASVGHWRLLVVFGEQCVVIAVAGTQVRVQRLPLAELGAYDAALWQRRTPRLLDAEALAAERGQLPAELAAADGQALHVWPVQQGQLSLGALSLLGFEPALGALDRKFIGLVAAALCTRIVALLTEQSLQAERLATERMAMEQRQAAIMGRLVNGVAHELNTPLGVQLAACGALEQLLDEAGLPAEPAREMRETIALVEHQVRRATRIVQRLKQISAAAQAAPRARIVLAEELQDIAAQHAGLEIDFGPLPDATLVLDRQALATVLGELLDNVRAHGVAADGHARVRIEAVRDGAVMLVRIVDQGPGLDARQSARLFEPFQTSRPAHGHMGIGGYIACNVAKEALDADLVLDTAPGRTCLTLRLPLVASSTASPP